MSEFERSVGDMPPSDFPVEPITASVGGAQPKLALCRNVDGAYVSPHRSSEEIMRRYEAANDLVGQLVCYFERKRAEFPTWTDEIHLERIRRGLGTKVKQGRWFYTEAEQQWVMVRLRERCCPAHPVDSAAGV